MADIHERVLQWDQDRVTETDSSLINPAAASDTHSQSYAQILERYKILARCGYDYYEDHISGSLNDHLESWLDQFEADEQPICFIASSCALFVSRQQIKALQHHIYERQIRRFLLEFIINQDGLPPHRHDLAVPKLNDLFQECIFIPLSQGANESDFMHENAIDLSGHEGRGLSGTSVEALINRVLLREGKYLAVDKPTKILNSKRIAIILEDFIGSGDTAIRKITRIAYGYPQFDNILLCPYICTERSIKKITRYFRKFHPSIANRVSILPALTLPISSRVFNKNCYHWKNSQLPINGDIIQQSLHAICHKYWDTNHHKDNERHPNYPRKKPYRPGGYNNSQILIVPYTNCPNNNPPIIWSTAPALGIPWKPLFEYRAKY
jgi:hypothetical protein